MLVKTVYRHSPRVYWSVLKEGRGYQSYFPTHIFFQIPLPSAHKQDKKYLSVRHTSSFLFAFAKLRLLNTIQQRPKIHKDLRTCSEDHRILLDCTKTHKKGSYADCHFTFLSFLPRMPGKGTARSVLKVFNMNLDVWHISTPLETIFTAF